MFGTLTYYRDNYFSVNLDTLNSTLICMKVYNGKQYVVFTYDRNKNISVSVWSDKKESSSYELECVLESNLKTETSEEIKEFALKCNLATGSDIDFVKEFNSVEKTYEDIF